MIGTGITPTRRPSRLAPALLPLVSMVMGLTGCGPTARPSDPDAGRKALHAALEAWQSGEKPDALAMRTPAVFVADGDWSSGLRLRSFRAGDEGHLVGSDLNYTVALELKGPRGKVIRKDAVYAVTTDPRIMVLRQDD